MKLSELFTGLPRRKASKVLGRGIGCGKGKTSGRGHKGQKARSGCAMKCFEGGQQPIYTRLPKRGFRSIFKVRYEIVNLGVVQKLLDDGKIVDRNQITKELLVDLGVISSLRSKVKILGGGKLEDKVGIYYDSVSKSAADSVFSLRT